MEKVSSAPRTQPSLKVIVHWLGLGLVVVVYVSAIVWLGVSSTVPGSPDESANNFFINQKNTTGSFSYQTPLTPEQLTNFHPRSMVVQGSTVLSGSWPGLLIAGHWLDSVFGSKAHYVLVPLLSIVGLLALYQIGRRYWEPKWCWLAVSLLALHPAWVQFQTLPLFHNGAFVSLLLVVGWLLVRQQEKPSLKRAAVFGLAYGAALFFRPSEILWTGPLVAIVLLSMPNGWKWLSTTVVITAAVQIPWLLQNHQLYGQWLASGYAPAGFTAANDQEITGRQTKIWDVLKPAGGQWTWNFWSTVWWFVVLLQPAWSLAALVALGRYYHRKMVTWTKIIKLSLATMFGLWLIVYYGSWSLYPNVPATTVGSLASYVRYWLPLYVAMAAGVTVFFRQWSTQPFLKVIVIAAVFMSQVFTVMAHPNAGLVHRHQQQATISAKITQVVSQTENNALIVAGQFDKYLYGQRLTTFSLPQTENQWRVFRTLIGDRPVYVYAGPTAYRRTRVEQDLALIDARISQEISIGRDQLWRVVPGPATAQ